MEGFHHPPDRRLAEIAARQEGVVSIAQTRAAQLGQGALEHRVRQGRLHRVHTGVYALGCRPLGFRGTLWAAVLARGGPGCAVLSHQSAAVLWDLLASVRGPVHVTTRHQSASTQAIRAHRSGTLEWSTDVTEIDGLPVTTVGRTLVDLADVLDPYKLQRVCHRAQHLGLLDVATIDPGPGRRTRALQAAFATLARAEPQVTRNDFEEALLALVDRAGLPAPRCNVPLLGYVADFVWPDDLVVVETDGRDHRRASRYESDRERDAKMLLAGYRVVRFTWRQVTERPDYVVATLRALLASGPSRARP
jgi:very-short-patch-repair endonuclease